MTTTETGIVVTGVLGDDTRYARTPSEVAELVRALLTTPYAELRVGPEAHHLTIATTPGWGALTFTTADDHVDSHNPDAPHDAPLLPKDAAGTRHYPTTASLPLDQVSEAVAEYCLTAQRPACVLWQPA
ncbi:Imm1 family immunity protein [Saccharopolyspora cebuensis]|uniref:Imm1 family immunity protein n=1 Tax=Saccharopolyspora cebuensis TaxID=418759 RepID=A0ABV4CTZ4_9PSEU